MWNKIVKRNLYEKNNIQFLEKIFMKEDLDATLKLVYCAKKIGKVNEALYNYVMHKEQGTKLISKEKRIIDEYNLYIDLEEYFFNKGGCAEILKIINSKKWRLYKRILKRNYTDIIIYDEVKKIVKNNKNEIFHLDWNFLLKLDFMYIQFFLFNKII